MFISRLFIKNFRNLQHFDVEIGQGITCFIGENNSGKTNIFQALRLVLDGNISAYRRRYSLKIYGRTDIRVPEHVLVAVEFSDFAGRPNEEACLYCGTRKRQGPALLSLQAESNGT